MRGQPLLHLGGDEMTMTAQSWDWLAMLPFFALFTVLFVAMRLIDELTKPEVLGTIVPSILAAKGV